MSIRKYQDNYPLVNLEKGGFIYIKKGFYWNYLQ